MIGLGDIIGDIVGDVVQEAGHFAVKAVHRRWGAAGCAAVLLGTVTIIGVAIWCIAH